MARIIMHLDMDSYFASVEQQAWPALRRKAIGVTGKPLESTIIVTASKEGKKYGLKPGMPVWEARRLCPHLLLVPGNPGRYMDTTQRILDILKSYTPLIEVFSIDEVFMDVTQEAGSLRGAIPIAQSIKERFRAALGPCITATIGIAENKTFSKLIAKLHKPDGIGVLDPEELSALLEDTPVGKLCGIGPRIERRLDRWGIRTLRELGQCPETLLKREFGVYGYFLKAVGLGHDPTPLVPYAEVPPPKSAGHSRTLPLDLRDIDLALVVLRGLCDQVGRRLRKYGYRGRTVYLGFGTEVVGGHQGKQLTLPIPTDDGMEIYAGCMAILQAFPTRPKSVARIGVSVSNLVDREGLPVSLLEEDHQRDRLNNALDRIRDRFGEKAIRYGSTILPRAIPDHVGGFTQTASFEF